MFEDTNTSSAQLLDEGQDRLLSCKQAAELTGIPERSIRELFNNRAIELVKFNRRLYVRQSVLKKFIEDRTIEPKCVPYGEVAF